MKQIEHIGIAVNDLATSVPLFETLLQTTCYKTEIVQSEQVATAFFACGNSKIELLQSLNDDGIIAKFIAKRGEGMHHIAFLVDDIYAEINRLKAEGFAFINEEPKIGADNKLICFLRPKETNGVLIELCQENNNKLDDKN
ncbi:methylmalonyl-CoA epimerase [Parasediminibacterium paludis]|uniref:Methylmalonyl-CoA epimerase n=1 Tax=Parasediminibacterium paludis TaxID=908966 RepID=A0ABV8PY19_9BACT